MTLHQAPPPAMRIAASVRWIALAQGGRLAAQLISVAVLTRFIAPAEYGLMALAMTVTNLAFLFRDMGAAPAIIQRPVLTAALQATVWWINLALGLAVALVLVALAYPLGRFYDQPRLTEVIIVLALVFPVSALAMLHQTLLERDSRFDLLAQAELGGAIAGLAGALALALAGAGIWSLVLQMLVAALTTTLLLLRACPFRPARLFCRRELDALLGSSARFSAFRLVTWFERNVDSLIIAKLLGPALLGVYALAMKIMLLPVQNLAAVAARAIFPALCRQRGDTAAMGALYLRAVAAVSMATAPAMAGLFVLREPLVALLFGPGWAEVATLLKWLAPVGFIQALTTGTGAVFLALDQSRLLLRLGVLGTTLMVAAFVIGPRWGIEGVAACYLVANLLNLLPCFYLALRTLHLRWQAGAAAVGPSLIAALLMIAALDSLAAPLAQLHSGPAAGLAWRVLAGAICYGAALLALLALGKGSAGLRRLMAWR